MKIEIADPLTEDYSPWGETIDPADIEKIVRSINWSRLSAVKLTNVNGDYLDCSGSKSPRDGFSIIFSENGEEFITQNPPRTVDEIVLVCQSYLIGDDKWKQLYSWKIIKPPSKSGCLALIVFSATILFYLINRFFT